MPICLADITRFMRPRICILDGIRILKNNGPKGGNLADVETKLAVAAGTDIIALDAWGAELMGHKPSEIGAIVKGQEAGLGNVDFRSIARESWSHGSDGYWPCSMTRSSMSMAGSPPLLTDLSMPIYDPMLKIWPLQMSFLFSMIFIRQLMPSST